MTRSSFCQVHGGCQEQVRELVVPSVRSNTLIPIWTRVTLPFQLINRGFRASITIMASIDANVPAGVALRNRIFC